MDTATLFLVGFTVLILLLVGYAVYRKFQRDSDELSRRFEFGEEGIVEREEDQPIQFQGIGAESTRQFRLEAGDYKLRYRFPDGVTVQVELFSHDGQHETVVLTSGAGEAGFSVSQTGRYLLDIDPQQEDAAWKLEITRLGLPSACAQTTHP